MSFSFRSMFQASPDASQEGGATPVDGLKSAFSLAPESPSPMMTASSPPLNATSPFGVPLFKIAAGESHSAAPVQHSVFSAAGAASMGSPLTVADVLPLLPPDVARAGALPPEQPVAISAQVLDAALRGGQAAIPIFEIYRVCPAMFQMPISPQDPRMIPLPAAKLPRLIAATQPGQLPPAGPPPQPSAASPFSMQQPAMMAPAAESGMLLPPRRQGPPPPLADVPSKESAATPQLSLPGQGAQAFPMSPFAAVGAQIAAAASPFTAPQAPAEPSFQQPQAPSPFLASAQPSQPLASPFGTMPPAAATPFAAAAATSTPESAFSTLFGAKAAPTGQSAPDAMPARPAVTMAASVSVPTIRISLASLLRGYTAAELGFDPMVVPTWITTSLAASKMQELIVSPTALCELGLLVDGITDVGFRNVLNTAKRDFQLRMPHEELHAALNGASAPASLPNLSSLGQPAAQSPAPVFAPQNQVMRVEQAMPQASPFAPVITIETATVPGTNSPFLAPSTAMSYAEASIPQQAATFFTPASAPLAAQAPIFAPAPQVAAAPPSSVFQSIAPQVGAVASPFGMPATALQPLQQRAFDPFAAQPPAQQSAAPPAYAPAAVEFYTPPAPEPAPVFAFSPPAPPAPIQQIPTAPTFVAPVYEAPIFQPPVVAAEMRSPMAETTVLPPERPQEMPHMTNPFNQSLYAQAEGFSGDQLLGRQPTIEQNWSAAAAAAAIAPFAPSYSSESRQPYSSVIDVPAAPSSFFGASEVYPEEAPPARPAFTQAPPEPVYTAPPPASQRAASPKSSLGVQMHDTDPDQILLRALLDTDSELTPQKVVEMACGLPGIAACVCIHGDRAISHIGAHKPQAREFQRQATDLAQHLKTLAPLIGIEGAETFTMNSGDRLMTFCFPEGAILGVLHDAEPTLGLRDKITLIARELARMIA